jgi:hypothetical protein
VVPQALDELLLALIIVTAQVSQQFVQVFFPSRSTPQ